MTPPIGPADIPTYRVSLVREGLIAVPRPQVRGPADVAELVRSYLADADREHLVAILLDTKHRVVGISTISVGTLDGAPAHPREVFKVAIVGNAAAIILAHNHPSGDPWPSPEDMAVTRRMKRAGDLLGIPLLDHIIVGEQSSASLRAEGLLDGGRSQ